MEIPQGNFFEVTINSEKLLTHIQQLTLQLQQQKSQIDKVTNQANNFEDIILEKVNVKLSNQGIEWQKQYQKMKEDLYHLKMLFQDLEKKLENKLNDHDQHIKLNLSRLNQMKEGIDDKINLKLSYFQKKLKNNITLKELESYLKEQSEKREEEIQNLAIREDGISLKLEKQVNRINKTIKYLEERQAESEFHFRRETSEEIQKNMSVTFDRFPDRSQTLQSLSKRKRSQRNGKIIEQKEDIQKFVSKMQVLESRLKEKQAKSKEKVMSQLRGKQLSKVILEKLTIMANQHSASSEEVNEKFAKMMNKYEIINEQVLILNRKIDKYKTQQVQTIDLVKHLEDKKMDQKNIEQLKKNMKQIVRQFDQNLSSKLQKQVHQQYAKKMKEKYKYVLGLTDEKADKSQVKKLANFMEEKIKDIIIVLAQQKNLNKDSAIKKLPVKCLTCDKTLELNQESQNQAKNDHRSMRSSINLHTARPSTNLIRKRNRMANTHISGDI